MVVSQLQVINSFHPSFKRKGECISLLSEQRGNVERRTSNCLQHFTLQLEEVWLQLRHRNPLNFGNSDIITMQRGHFHWVKGVTHKSISLGYKCDELISKCGISPSEDGSAVEIDLGPSPS